MELDHMPLVAMILQSIPESFALLLFALALTHSKFKWKQLTLASFLAALDTFIFRSLPIPYGVNLVIAIPILFFIVKLVFKTSFKRAVLISILGLTALGLAEGVAIPFLLWLTGISLKQVLNSSFLRIVFPIPHVFGLFLLGFYLLKKEIYLFEKDFLK